MTKKKRDQRGVEIEFGREGMSITFDDGLTKIDAESYGKKLPNKSDHPRFIQYYEASFIELMRERVEFCERIFLDNAEERFTREDLTISVLSEMMVRFEPFSAPYFAARYLLHGELFDQFIEQDQSISAYRELYFAGEIWATARFMVNHREEAQHGRKFPVGKTGAATNTRSQRKSKRDAHIVLMAGRVLENFQEVRINGGRINQARLSREVARALGPSLRISNRTVRAVIYDAIKTGELA